MEQHRGSYTSVGNAGSTIEDKVLRLKCVAAQHKLNKNVVLSSFLCLQFL